MLITILNILGMFPPTEHHIWWGRCSVTTLHLRKEGLNRPIEIVIVLSEGGKTVEPQPFLGVSVKKSGNVRNQSPLDSRCHQRIKSSFLHSHPPLYKQIQYTPCCWLYITITYVCIMIMMYVNVYIYIILIYPVTIWLSSLFLIIVSDTRSWFGPKVGY